MVTTPGIESTTYTLARVQEMLGLPRRVVARLMAAGFVSPTRGRRGEWRFTFQDLTLLRTAHTLQAQRIPTRRIVQSLAQLKASLPAELPLSGLRITAHGSDIAVRERSGRLRAGTGQLLLDFDVAPVAGTVTMIERAPAAHAESPDPQQLFQTAFALEATDPAAAEAAYLQVISLAPRMEDAYLNLGAMFDAAGRYSELLRLCDAALTHCPDAALIHFNRGVALDQLHRPEGAAASYERSLELDPGLADAHYNLAQLHQQAGDERGALRHLSAYRRLQRPA